MRSITKTISIPVDGKPLDFRLTKLDAFSGVALLRMLSSVPDGSFVSGMITHLSDADLRSLMTACLEHCEVLLPAGWNPVMTRGEWCFPELEYDPAACLKLTVEEALWTLDGFFGGGASDSPPGTPAT